MADGSEQRLRQFIAYQDEEHGLGHKVARDFIESARDSFKPDDLEKGSTPSPVGSLRSSPRRTSHQTIATLIGKQAQKAIVPLQNDLGGYDKKTLEALIEFTGYEIVAGHEAADEYVLAVPLSQVMELGEASFPSAFKNRPHAIGNLPNGEAARNMLRNRIGRVYASADAIDRCAAAIDGLESQGIEVSRLPDHVNPYRTVLQEAHDGLDPDRLITTSINEKTGTLERHSRSTGKNYAKMLNAVLLPANSVFLGQGDVMSGRESPDTFDYVVVDDQLEGNMPIKTRFLLLNKIEYFKRTKSRGTSNIRLFEGWMGKVEKGFEAARSPFRRDGKDFKYSRALIKVNSRGKDVKDVGLVSKKLTDRKIPYEMTTLNDWPETLPVVFEIEIENDDEARKRAKAFFRDIQFECVAWDIKFLGAYGTDTAMPESARNLLESDSWWEKVMKVLVPIMALIILGMSAFLVWYFFLSDRGEASAAAPTKPATLAESTPAEPVPEKSAVSALPVTANAACSDDTLQPAYDIEVIRTAPDHYWVCGNEALATPVRTEATCRGGTSAADYAAAAPAAQPAATIAASLAANPVVANRLCEASALVVTGSASSSPYENNNALPPARAGALANALTQELQGVCSTAPTIKALSLGVAGCAVPLPDGTCSVASDRVDDRQLMIVALHGRGTEVATPHLQEIEASLGTWLNASGATATMPLLQRLTDTQAFGLNQFVWAENGSAAQLHLAAAAPACTE